MERASLHGQNPSPQARRLLWPTHQIGILHRLPGRSLAQVCPLRWATIIGPSHRFHSRIGRTKRCRGRVGVRVHHDGSVILSVFRGRPTGRRLGSRSKAAALRCFRSASPQGRPSLTLVRRSSKPHGQAAATPAKRRECLTSDRQLFWKKSSASRPPWAWASAPS
jgi:hypothetical protein